MKKHLMRVGTLSIVTLLLGSHVGASSWDHTLGSQGSDGTLWANIPGPASSNQANLTLPYAECGIGFHQSPIAINFTQSPIATNPKTFSIDNNPQAETERHADRLVAEYARSISSTEGPAVSTDDGNAYVFLNTGHAVQVAFSRGYLGRLLVGRDVYPLVQFHFHTPSEHIIETASHPAGIQYAGELHFVHQREDGKLAVLTVFLDDSHSSAAENHILRTIITHTPKEPAHGDHPAFNSTGAGIFLDPSRLIPMESEHVFTYAGSLTTPPCSEGVSWYLLSEPLRVAPSQIQQLREFYHSNSRIIQNTNYSNTNAQRTVKIHKHLHIDRDHDRDHDSKRY
ncbi:MAG: carbonic anhydrase family protein [Nitrospira sp.]|nr:carbonic anhydrase family protein [Nitrospira sp.]